jgi:hypothetical protein
MMHNAAKDGQVKLDSGECIHSWVLLDDKGAVVDHQELDDIQIADAYNENFKWDGQEHEKVR